MKSRGTGLSLGDLALKAINLGKSFRIYNGPRDRLKQALWRGRRKYYREFWALRNISFEIHRGETLGIIGKNGSGKSTLLQMICGTLTPSEGTVQSYGRIAALLELGSGFNPEFTGIENIYLNGSLLGLGKSDIDEQMDKILAFADIGDFVDQPVKTYSSGMSMRLAFAVLAHSDPEILVVDEALAVGDSAFNQKCMRFIQRVKENKVLLYVSHDPSSIASLCDHALWLHNGKVQGRGEVRQILDLYSKVCYEDNQETDLGLTKEPTAPYPNKGAALLERTANLGAQRTNRTVINVTDFDGKTFGDGKILIRSVTLFDVDSPNEEIKPLRGGEQIQLNVLAECVSDTNVPSLCGFIVRNKMGLTMFGENTFKPLLPSNGPIPKQGQWMMATFRWSMPVLQTGTYMVSISWASGSQGDHAQNCYIHDLIELESNAGSYRPIHGLFGCPIEEISIKAY